MWRVFGRRRGGEGGRDGLRMRGWNARQRAGQAAATASAAAAAEDEVEEEEEEGLSRSAATATADNEDGFGRTSDDHMRTPPVLFARNDEENPPSRSTWCTHAVE